jgi:TonB family protein
MKPTSYVFHATNVSTLGLLVALAGCANTPTRLATIETDSSPALVVSANRNQAAPVAVNRVSPIYPVDLRRTGTEGSVQVIALIDETGKVQEPRVEGYHQAAFAKAALDAVKQWTFQPAMRDGVPVAERVSIPIDFKLDND